MLQHNLACGEAAAAAAVRLNPAPFPFAALGGSGSFGALLFSHFIRFQWAPAFAYTFSSATLMLFPLTQRAANIATVDSAQSRINIIIVIRRAHVRNSCRDTYGAILLLQLLHRRVFRFQVRPRRRRRRRFSYPGQAAQLDVRECAAARCVARRKSLAAISRCSLALRRSRFLFGSLF